MGLFDKLKEQALNSINDLTGNLQEKVNSAKNQQDSLTTPSMSQQQMASPSTQTPPSKGGNGLYGEYMEQLIEMALADGELTEKEKQVLFKKAEANGIDLDEFEMVINARLYEMQTAMRTNQLQKASYEERESNAIREESVFSKLAEKLQAIEDRQPSKFATMFRDTEEVITERKIMTINGFPLPKSKKQILEFLSMAAPLGKKATKNSLFVDPFEYDLAKAWRAKCEQLIKMCRLTLKNDEEAMALIEEYANELKIK